MPDHSKSFPFFIFLAIVCQPVLSQHYDPFVIFAHNDYVRDNPFFEAHALGVGFIEADVFLVDGELMVAHHRNEVAEGRTLTDLYLRPLSEKVRTNGGTPYADKNRSLTLMIDLKTEGKATLEAVVAEVSRFTALIQAKNLHIMISGNVPTPEIWDRYPSFITFDGRPGTQYSAAQWQRIRMISTNFNAHIKWDGRGPFPEAGERKLDSLMKAAHERDKLFRFWATPDFPDAWRELLQAGVDVVVTDDVSALSRFLSAKNSQEH